MTAHDLLLALTASDCLPSVDASDLAFDRDVPPHLEPLVEVLATGLRALLTRRRWFGIDRDGRGCGPLDYGALDPYHLLPPEVCLLTVEGEDAGWDRVKNDWLKDRRTALAFASHHPSVASRRK